MRISAIGRAEAEGGFTPSWRSAEHGFTLVELLIVLTIIGLLSAAVVIALPNGGGSLRMEAERFAARAKAAQDRAIVEGRPVAVSLTGAGYAFEERRQTEWRTLAVDAFAYQRWAEGTSFGGGTVRIVFDSTGLADPTELLLQRGNDQAAILIESGGRISIDG